jgi:hypothetical protein
MLRWLFHNNTKAIIAEGDLALISCLALWGSVINTTYLTYNCIMGEEEIGSYHTYIITSIVNSFGFKYDCVASRTAVN